MLRCPVCEKTDMVVLELEGIEIDYCLKCGGIWLDSGELELLIGSDEGKNEILSSFHDAEKKCNEKKRPCPICSKAMKKVEVNHRQIVIRPRQLQCLSQILKNFDGFIGVFQRKSISIKLPVRIGQLLINRSDSKIIFLATENEASLFENVDGG